MREVSEVKCATSRFPVGAISVASRQGEGSRFTIRIPLSPGAQLANGATRELTVERV